jgi:hypothetical protein
MIGSAAIAAWIAQAAFWGLLAFGWATGELQARGRVVFLVLWFAAFFGLPYLPYGAALFSSFVAALDVALVLIIFKGDITIT